MNLTKLQVNFTSANLYQTWLKYYTLGKLIAVTVPLNLIVFLYSIREFYIFKHPVISSGLTCIIFSEIMLFAGYFWGVYNYLLTSKEEEGIISPNSSSLILNITLLLAALAIIMNNYYLFSNSSIILAYIISLLFCSLQVIEYTSMNFFINDDQLGTYFYTITGLHFYHVFVGILLLFVFFWRDNKIYQSNGKILQQKRIHKSNIVLHNPDFFIVLYYHFVETLWIAIFFTFYTY